MRVRLSNGLAMGYRSQGVGRSLVLLHPIGTRAEFWDGVAHHLAGSCRSLSIDLRGCGESDTPLSRFSIEDLADDVLELVRAQALQGAVVIGCSMGGMVAQGMVLKAPWLFSGMVLAGTLNTQTAERRKIPLQRAVDALGGMPSVVDGTLKRWLPPEVLAADGPVVQDLRRWLLELDPVVFSWGWEAIADLAYGDRLREIQVPSLLIRGTEDAAGRTMPEMAELLPRGRFVEMPGVGHMAPMEQPEAFAALVRDFIRQDIDG